MRCATPATLLTLLLLVGAAGAAPAPFGPVDTFTLDNGLRVVVQTDRATPVVGVTVLYGVGSRHEAGGRTGFAHLFEHLMFAGSEHHPAPFGPALAAAGVQRANAATWWDHTVFFETVPTSALDFALFLEADRMGHFAGTITQAQLDVDRGVVKNEKRQKEGQPYGRVETPILEAVFPPGHPYRWSPLGTVRDLESASVADVTAWHRTHYTPDNAVLVLAGDVDVTQARALATRYFGPLAPGSPRTELAEWTPRPPTLVRETQYDRVPNPRLYVAWPGPRRAARERVDLDVLVASLGRGPGARLARALVERERLASAVSFDVIPGELASLVLLTVNLRAGASAAAAERIVDDELAALRQRGPDPERLRVAAAGARARLLRAVEPVGGPDGRSMALALGAQYASDPRFVETEIAWLSMTDVGRARAVAQRFLVPESYRLTVLPAARLRASDAAAPTEPPAVGDPRPPSLPTVERTTLEDGTTIEVARRPGAAVAAVALSYPLGYASDPPDLRGAAELTFNALLAPTADFDPTAEADRIGADLDVRTRARTSSWRLVLPADALARGLDLLARVATRPLPDGASFEAARATAQGRAARASSEAGPQAQRALLRALLGETHPYATFPTGVGDPTALAAGVRGALVAWRDHGRACAPTLRVVGDVSLAQVRELAARAFGVTAPTSGGLRPTDAPSTRRCDASAAADPSELGAARVLAIEVPGAGQTYLAAGRRVPGYDRAVNAPIDLAVALFGDRDGSRLETNLRAKHGWAYWTRASLSATPGARVLLLETPVQADRTADAVREIREELRRVVGDAPPRDDEVAMRARREALRFPARFETTAAVVEQLTDDAESGAPNVDAVARATAAFGTSPEDVRRAARSLFDAPFTWVLVGDRRAIESAAAELPAPLEWVNR